MAAICSWHLGLCRRAGKGENKTLEVGSSRDCSTQTNTPKPWGVFGCKMLLCPSPLLPRVGVLSFWCSAPHRQEHGPHGMSPSSYILPGMHRSSRECCSERHRPTGLRLCCSPATHSPVPIAHRSRRASTYSQNRAAPPGSPEPARAGGKQPNPAPHPSPPTGGSERSPIHHPDSVCFLHSAKLKQAKQISRSHLFPT